MRPILSLCAISLLILSLCLQPVAANSLWGFWADRSRGTLWDFLNQPGALTVDHLAQLGAVLTPQQDDPYVLHYRGGPLRFQNIRAKTIDLQIAKDPTASLPHVLILQDFNDCLSEDMLKQHYPKLTIREQTDPNAKPENHYFMTPTSWGVLDFTMGHRNQCIDRISVQVNRRLN